ncbi:succinate-semialdehyde dehydrogenase / glutarate-semialdehyde dehydrogenase [Arachidicoccus rhizosphaerae]|uniref:Succinate-semialdehyde dehydrogenase / glutarate-semialdehyde dehydrogenase n=1 Tax=Arachidicoccus rhizosphaerae TaxID=551991 RepID=A0A1H4AM45_9BACT|nr:NAD-dependent succinate-semialdehyde dehydrogenase [Arachidicoccus rhizosphaerae]SEA36881.1 succinate-semialdehyde dehydrogenase / glutarate-semialdehyde dehydrogenase [Arachidicoccus rhizosphaerae]
MESINPANNQILKKYKNDKQPAVQAKIDNAARVFPYWRKTSYSSRANLLKKTANVLLNNKEQLAKLMALEMGKPLKEGVGEIEKCAWVCNYYAKNGAGFLKDLPVETDAASSYISYQPIGTILAVMPWNFPFWQVFRFIAPSIFAGNCGLLKHASNVPGCAIAIEKAMLEAGFPAGVFQTLLIDSKQVAKVLEAPSVRAVTLTGSTAAGQQVAAKAASLIKKSVLELGGSDPYLILKNADLELAATVCANSRLINNGQSCIAAKRFIVDRSVAEKFTQLLKEKMSSKVMGDPLDPHTDLGPMSRIDLRDELHELVLQNKKAGAQVLLGGELPEQSKNNAFYPPTILYNVKKSMSAYTEEIFGPVASIILAADTQDAIAIANDTSFGLGAAVFTKSKREGERIAREELDAGACFVNSLVKSDPRLPFGGVKMSGYGRELGLHGIHEFVNIKTVYVADTEKNNTPKKAKVTKVTKAGKAAPAKKTAGKAKAKTAKPALKK